MDIDYDLAVSVGADKEPSIMDAGVGPASAVPVDSDSSGMALWPLVAGGWTALVVVVALTFGSRRRGVAAP